MDIVERILEKSKEAFMLSIELYNKPTIKYRIEGFSLFICNAWELMLKAHLINSKGMQSIYYKNNPDRTITLENCLKLIFTNKNTPARMNLEKIIELRNTSTHFITQEYEMVYIPLFQACVFNYIEKMREFHNIDVSDDIPQNFLTLSVNISSFDVDEIRAKYPEEIADKLIGYNEKLKPMIDENNNGFAVRVDHYYYITKDKNKATATVRIDNDSPNDVKIINRIKDPNETHKFTAKACISEINQRLRKAGVRLKYHGDEKDFNRYHFQLFCDHFGIKQNEKMCFTYKATSNKMYSYSIHTIELIVDEIKKDPENIIQNLKDKLNKKS